MNSGNEWGSNQRHQNYTAARPLSVTWSTYAS